MKHTVIPRGWSAWLQSLAWPDIAGWQAERVTSAELRNDRHIRNTLPGSRDT